MPMPSPSSSRPKEVRLFRNNRSQAVRIPVEFELPGDRALIRREGNRLIIEPTERPTTLAGFWLNGRPKIRSAQMTSCQALMIRQLVRKISFERISSGYEHNQ